MNNTILKILYKKNIIGVFEYNICIFNEVSMRKKTIYFTLQTSHVTQIDIKFKKKTRQKVYAADAGCGYLLCRYSSHFIHLGTRYSV